MTHHSADIINRNTRYFSGSLYLRPNKKTIKTRNETLKIGNFYEEAKLNDDRPLSPCDDILN